MVWGPGEQWPNDAAATRALPRTRGILDHPDHSKAGNTAQYARIRGTGSSINAESACGGRGSGEMPDEAPGHAGPRIPGDSRRGSDWNP